MERDTYIVRRVDRETEIEAGLRENEKDAERAH